MACNFVAFNISLIVSTLNVILWVVLLKFALKRELKRNFLEQED
jgi:hypothetical protein